MDRVELPGSRLPGPVQGLAFWAAPVEFVESARRRYGPCVRLNLPGFGEIAYLADPEAVKQVFTGGTDVYHAGEGNAIMKPILGARSVLILDEDAHLEQRRRLLPPFHGEAVRRWAETIRAIAEEEVAAWPVREPFAVRPRLQRLTLDVILRPVLGLTRGERLDALRRLLPRLLDIRLIDLVGLSLWPGFPESRLAPLARPLRLRRQVDALLYEEIAERRARAAGRDDVLSMLVESGASDEEIRDQVMTLLVAGHETTTTALAWALERLTRHPDALARAAERDSDYLDAVCRETLRVRPVIMDVVRRVTRDVEVGGGRVRAGAMVMPSIVLSHLDPGNYDDPYAFRPERFDGVKPGTYTWLPFGGGPRRCIGAAFALMEMRVVLDTVLSRVRLATTSAPGERARPKHVTLVPSQGGRIAVAERASAKALRQSAHTAAA